MGSEFDIRNDIPQHFRGIDDRDLEAFGEDRKLVISTLNSLLLNDLAAAGINGSEAWHFVKGFHNHLEAIHDKDSSWLRGTISRVEKFDSYNGSKIPGTKARIHFVNTQDEDEYLETSFIEYDYDAPWLAWEIALSRTLVDLAEANIGNDATFQKKMVDIDGGRKKKRELVNLRPLSGGGSGGSSSKPDPKKGSISERVDEWIDKLDEEGDLTEDDAKEITDILEKFTDVDELMEEAAAYLDIKRVKDKDPDEPDLVKWFVTLILDNI